LFTLVHKNLDHFFNKNVHKLWCVRDYIPCTDSVLLDWNRVLHCAIIVLYFCSCSVHDQLWEIIICNFWEYSFVPCFTEVDMQMAALKLFQHFKVVTGWPKSVTDSFVNIWWHNYAYTSLNCVHMELFFWQAICLDFISFYWIIHPFQAPICHGHPCTNNWR
jgi:hypothetical protein